MTREQRRTLSTLAELYDSLEVDENTEPLAVAGCEWPDTLAPRVLARFTVDQDGTPAVVES